MITSMARTAKAEVELVNIKAIEPTILVELRYATDRNIARRPLYPPGMPALVRPEVAGCLVQAHNELRARGYRLKIWDAYRPKSAHDQLWQLSPNQDYVADPAGGGSLHTWGVAVDATMADTKLKEVRMPTDFDEFTPAAMLYYNGRDQAVLRNIRTLQRAMGRAGFYGMRTEWWHFVVKNWKNYKAIDEAAVLARIPGAMEAPRAAVPATRASNTRSAR